MAISKPLVKRLDDCKSETPQTNILYQSKLRTGRDRIQGRFELWTNGLSLAVSSTSILFARIEFTAASINALRRKKNTSCVSLVLHGVTRCHWSSEILLRDILRHILGYSFSSVSLPTICTSVSPNLTTYYCLAPCTPERAWDLLVAKAQGCAIIPRTSIQP